MTNRTVAVSLTASVGGYISGMEQARKKTGQVSDEAKKKLEAQGKAFGELGTIATRAGVVAAAGIALAIVRFAEFDQAMSNVKAATQETAENMALLRDAALEAGGSTVFTATEAANAIEELGKAGISTADILGGGLDGALSLAAAGQLGVAEAAGFAAIAMTQFGLAGADIPHVADLLAAGAGKAGGDVDDLAQALNQAGLVANAAGFSIEDTTGVLAAFADAGLLGSDAGTSLKTAIIALQKPTAVAQKELDKYGISVYDATGNMLTFEGIAGQLETKLGGLTEQQRNATLATIFGTDALRSANVLYRQGADGIAKYVEQTNDSGYAAQVAADRMDNLAGDIEKLGGAFDTTLIKGGSGANDTLRMLVQSATFLVDGIAELPEPVTNVGLALGVAATAMLLVSGAVLTGIPKFAALKTTIAASSISLGTLAVRTAATGGALAAATLAVGFFVARQAEAAATTTELAGTLDKTTGATTNYTRELIRRKLAESEAFEAATEAGVSQKVLTDAILEGGDALDAVLDKINANNTIGEAFTGVAFRAGNARDTIRTLRTGLEDSTQRLEDMNAAGDESASTLTELASTGIAATSVIADLSDELRNFGDTTFDVIDAERAFYESIDAVTKRLGEDGFTRGLNQATEAGRANMDVLKEIARDTNDFAAATYAATGDIDAVNGILAAGKVKLDEAAAGFRTAEDSVRDYSAELIASPEVVRSRIELDTSGATNAMNTFLGRYQNNKILIEAQLRELQGRADGGAIYGPGGPRDDKAGLYRLSNGEHVLTAADVKALGGQSGVYAMRRNLYKGYADGGAVQYAPSSYGSSGPVSSSVDSSTVVNFNGPVGYAPEAIGAGIQKEKRRVNAMAGITGVVS